MQNMIEIEVNKFPKEILAQVKYQIDDTVKQTEDDVIVVILDTEEEKNMKTR